MGSYNLVFRNCNTFARGLADAIDRIESTYKVYSVPDAIGDFHYITIAKSKRD